MATLSFEGWDWKKFLIGHGKEVYRLLLPALVAFLSTGSFTTAAISAFVGRAIITTIEYYFKR